MAAEPVVITGLDQISALGNGLDELDAAIAHSRSGISAYDLNLPGIDPARIAVGRVSADLSDLQAPSKLPMDRATALALRVAQTAVAHAGLKPTQVNPLRLGVYWGSGMAGAHSFDTGCEALYAHQRRMRPTHVVTTMPNAALAEISLWLKAQGPCLSYACACASSAVAIGEALCALRAGRLDVAVVGGSESMLTPGVMASWNAMRVLAPALANPATSCQPFDTHRRGFALGEGAAALVLESAAHARQRGAHTVALLSGYGVGTDGTHITNPDVDGQVRAMRMALDDAGLEPGQIGYLNAHGTATAAGDLAEALSISTVFGEHPVPVSSTKALHGHLLGAGGAVELVIGVRSLIRRFLPGAAHIQEPDPRMALNLVPATGLHAPQVRHVMSNSFAFGGTNAVLIASAPAPGPKSDAGLGAG
ncbi:MAG: hypothetical protein RIT26_1762 [Pseudomonadota bacterium]|jgi:3-oxoacyl-[acyl-carrier-protein] synthase II